MGPGQIDRIPMPTEGFQRVEIEPTNPTEYMHHIFLLSICSARLYTWHSVWRRHQIWRDKPPRRVRFLCRWSRAQGSLCCDIALAWLVCALTTAIFYK